jgi:hypothetical protein
MSEMNARLATECASSSSMPISESALPGSSRIVSISRRRPCAGEFRTQYRSIGCSLDDRQKLAFDVLKAEMKTILSETVPW